VGIPDSILLKAGPLTPEERAVIERHPEIGENILRQTPKSVALLPHMNIRARTEVRPLPVGDGSPSALIMMAGTIARHHHEKWNGSGYPDKLAGLAIPIEARIVALADVYDALLSKRPYKPPMSPSKALAIVRKESGRHFDPQIVESFFAAGDRIAEVYERFDGTGEAV
jgi:putative two-component system response regulator